MSRPAGISISDIKLGQKDLPSSLAPLVRDRSTIAPIHFYLQCKINIRLVLKYIHRALLMTQPIIELRLTPHNPPPCNYPTSKYTFTLTCRYSFL